MNENKYVTWEMFEEYHKKLAEYIGMHDDLMLKGETTCPKCGGEHITWYTRVIGYLRPVSAFSKDRQIEASKRTYSKSI